MTSTAERALNWLRPHLLASSDGILTSAGICEGLAGAGVAANVLFLAAVGGLVAGALATGGSEYTKVAALRERQLALLADERLQLESDPEAELDELTRLYTARGLSSDLARQVALELTAHDALLAHAEVEHGITAASVPRPLRDATAVAIAFAAGALLPLIAMALLPGQLDAPVTYVIVILALALTGWLSARASDVHPVWPMIRTATIGVLAMTATFFAGTVIHR